MTSEELLSTLIKRRNEIRDLLLRDLEWQESLNDPANVKSRLTIFKNYTDWMRLTLVPFNQKSGYVFDFIPGLVMHDNQARGKALRYLLTLLPEREQMFEERVF